MEQLGITLVFAGIPSKIRISQNLCLPIILPQISQFSELCVTLYEKEETNNEEEPEEPLDDEVNGKRVWSDDFEGFNLASSWSYECVQGKSSWKHTYVFEGPTDKKPSAASGYGYISLEPEKNLTIGGTERKIINRLTTPLIELEYDAKYYLTGYYRIYDINKLPTDTLQILFRASESYHWNKIETYTTLERNQWKKFTIGFTNYESVQVAFEGLINSNASIFLDNIIITKDDVSNVAQNEILTDLFFDVYTTNGTFIGHKEISELDNLPSGVYILRNKDGVRKMVR